MKKVPGIEMTLLRRAVERPTPQPLRQGLKFAHQIHFAHGKGIAARLLRRPGNPPARTGKAPARPGGEMDTLEEPLKKSHEDRTVDEHRITFRHAGFKRRGKIIAQIEDTSNEQ